MTTRIATIEFDRDARTWRLYAPDRGQELALPVGFRGVVEPEERSLVRAVLRAWGLRPAVAMSDWAPTGGQSWILPVDDYVDDCAGV